MKNKHFLLVTLVFMAMACSNDNEDDLINMEPEISIVTYEDVRSIFQNNCISCHSSPPTNGASVPLTNYNSVRSAVENNMLIDRINSTQPGFGMPLGGQKLPQNLIDLIEQWQMDGLLEN